MPIPFTKHINSLPQTIPFVGPETTERMTGRLFLARIGANESVFGPSPNAIQAMQAACGESWKYCDPENYELRYALAEKLEVEPENIVVGEGIDGLLGLAVRCFVEPGVGVVMPDGAYPTFAFHVNGFDGKLIKIPYVDDHEPIDGLLAAARDVKASILYFTNPDNPLGSWWQKDAVEAMIGDLPSDCMLFLDEAYGEFAALNKLAPIDVTNENVLRFRTFSKAYGMAGARIGYAIGHEDVIGAINKIRNQYGVNRLAQIGALAALKDQAWLEKVCQWTEDGRQRIYQIAEANGLSAIGSATNFVAVDCGRDAQYAKRVLEGLIAKGVFVRMPFAAPGNRCIRIGVGKQEDLDLLEEVIGCVLREA